MTVPGGCPPVTVLLHGPGPHRVAVLHGGPGGAGEVGPLERALAQRGVPCLEPLQTADSVARQVAELRAQIVAHSTPPLAVVGWSWGAWLGCLLAAAHPDLVSHLVLVASAPFRKADHLTIKASRQSRLSLQEQQEMAELRSGPLDPVSAARLVHLMEVSDCVAPDHEPVRVTFDYGINAAVWAEAAALRRSGALLETLIQIRCLITAIHGEEDAHPVAGVFEPLVDCQPKAKLRRLTRCGHKPWIERYAKAEFYDALTQSLRPRSREERPG